MYVLRKGGQLSLSLGITSSKDDELLSVTFPGCTGKATCSKRQLVKIKGKSEMKRDERWVEKERILKTLLRL